MFEGFVVTSKKRKAEEFLAAMKREVKDWRPDLDQDFLDYMSLSMAAGNHKDDDIDLVYAEIVIPMIMGNYIILRDQGKIVAYASWGFFSKQVSDAKMRTRKWLLTREDYNTGREIWLMDVIAPYGHYRKIIAELIKRKHDLGLHDDRINFRRFYTDRNKERFNDAIC
jgi:hemolysin-activating ACP:hemolysin acyltransferase